MIIKVYKGQDLVSENNFDEEIAFLGDDEAAFFVGRSQDCQIVLDDMQVSREHAQIIHKKGKWKIKRLSPVSELFLNGQQVSEEEIKNNDLISIGPYSMSIINSDAFEAQDEDEKPRGQKTETRPFPLENDSNQTKEGTATVADEEGLYQESSDQETEAKSLNGESSALEQQNFEQNEFSNQEENQEGFAVEDDNLLGDDLLPVADDDYNDAGSDGTKVFKGFARFELEIFGEYAPYDKYVVENNEVFIGRDPAKCQIVLKDPEVSSVHAVIRKNNITCSIEDLQSSNGTLLNGARINKTDITNNDEFIIGGTTFTVHIYSELIKQEEDRLMPVEQNQVVEVEEIVEVDDEGFDDESLELGEGSENAPEEKSIIKRIWKNPEKRKKFLYGAVAIMVLWMFLDDGSTPNNQSQGEGTKTSNSKDKTDNKDAKVAASKEKPLTPEQKQAVESAYQLAREFHDAGRYGEALAELDKIFAITSNYKEARSLKESASEGLARIEELERKRREETERKILMQKVKDLLVKAKEATKERNVEVAEALFGQILALDPENFDVTQLKVELDAWKREQQRIALEKAQKEADRKRRVSQLQPGKNLYLRKEWFQAILKLEDFLKIKDMDEDLTLEATKMLEESKKELNDRVSPLLGKARSLIEGQDLKGAYENYMLVLVYDPINKEALNETNNIRQTLDIKARKVYREAIISESLSLFNDAKEKFQEVQQISPSDSEYYKKATDKLREYID